MNSTIRRQKAEEILASAGIQVNGDRPWDMQVHDSRVFPRMLRQGPYGLGEAYVAGFWDCARLDELLFRLLTSKEAQARTTIGR
ncbi:MAG TPA: hypothetical protein VMN76_11605 [Acidobacteriota bacterium]|nr:hypothetical protein [Acidobacteriota bacterium]